MAQARVKKSKEPVAKKAKAPRPSSTRARLDDTRAQARGGDQDALSARMREVLRVLKRTYPDAECSLTHRDPFQLLVATILSAQCTDERVNLVTPALFAKYPDAAGLARAKLGDVEKLIQSTGFYKSKALSITEAAKALVSEHQGEVPKDLNSLIKLRGVGRKTANVVLGVAYGLSEGIVVDTHVGRLSRRMGFTRETDPVAVEQELIRITPREDWVELAHLMIYHGRAICSARKALCEECPVAGLCPRIGV